MSTEEELLDEIDKALAELDQANEALLRLVVWAGWLQLGHAAGQLKVSKGSVSDAIRRRAIRAVRTLPRGAGARGSVVVWVEPASLARYSPRAYPGRA